MSFINHAWMLDRARAFLGQAVIGPVDFADGDLLKCLDQVTLPVFSVYMPHYQDVKVDTERDRAYSGREGIFVLRPEGGLTVLGVSEIRDANSSLDFVGTPYDPMNYTDVTDRQFATDFLSGVQTRMTFEFSPPNIVEVFPKGYAHSNLLFKCKLVHPTTLRTVPPGAVEVLTELYLADLCSDILGVRAFFQVLQTPFGEIQLNLDRINEKASGRKEIIEELTRKQHKTSQATRIIFA